MTTAHHTIEPDMPAALPRRLLRCLLHLSRRARGGAAGAALPSVPVQVLGLLYRLPRATPTELAAELGIRKQSLTTLLAMLADKGYLRREQAPGDARKALLSLTDAGREAFLREMEARSCRLARHVAATLSPDEIASLQAVLPVLEKLALGGEGRGGGAAAPADTEDTGPCSA